MMKGLYIRGFLLCLFELSFIISVHAQSHKRSFIIGAGAHENLYAGIQFPLGDKFYLETAAGLNPFTIKTRKFAMFYAAPGISLVKYKSTRKVEPFFHIKNMIWYSEDSYNRFFVFGLNPEFRLSWIIKRRLNIAATAGVMYNTVLNFTRKSDAFPVNPRELEPSLSLQFCYQLLN
jgi:hypothetical protein